MTESQHDIPISTKPSFLKRWLGWRILTLSAVVLILLSPLLYRGWRLGKVPMTDEPFDVEAFLTEVPRDENSYFDFDQAGRELRPVPRADYEKFRDQLEAGWDVGTVVLDRHLENNRTALETWRVAAKKDRYQPPPVTGPDEYPLIAVQLTREFNWLATIQVEKLSRTNHPAEAIPWIEAQLRFVHLIRQNGVQLDYSVGAAFFSFVANSTNAWAAYPDLTNAEIRRVRQSLETARRLNPLSSENTKANYLADTKFYSSQSLEDTMTAYLTSGKEPPLGPKWEWWLAAEPEFTLRLFPHITQNHLRFIDKPRRDRPPLIGDRLFDDSSIKPPNHNEINSDDLTQLIAQSHLLEGMSFGYLKGGLYAADKDEVRYRCLTVSLAAQAYFRDHGEFPADANELVPEYLDEIPDDLYSPTPAPLIYRRDGHGAVVYSRFTNEIDDGGTEVSYDDRRIGGDLLDFGFRIRNPLDRPLSAPKPPRD